MVVPVNQLTPSKPHASETLTSPSSIYMDWSNTTPLPTNPCPAVQSQLVPPSISSQRFGMDCTQRNWSLLFPEPTVIPINTNHRSPYSTMLHTPMSTTSALYEMSTGDTFFRLHQPSSSFFQTPSATVGSHTMPLHSTEESSTATPKKPKVKAFNISDILS